MSANTEKLSPAPTEQEIAALRAVYGDAAAQAALRSLNAPSDAQPAHRIIDGKQRKVVTEEMEMAAWLERREYQRSHPVSDAKEGTKTWAHDVIYCPKQSIAHLTADQAAPFRRQARLLLDLQRENEEWGIAQVTKCNWRGRLCYVQSASLLHCGEDAYGDFLWVLLPTKVNPGSVVGTAYLTTYRDDIEVIG